MATNDTDCPVCACAEIISGKWTLLVIRDGKIKERFVGLRNKATLAAALDAAIAG